MQNLLSIDIPVFQPKYKKWKKYGYTDSREKQNLKEVLKVATGGYCMYCYSRINTDGKFVGHLEHAIEKNNSDRLLECIPKYRTKQLRDFVGLVIDMNGKIPNYEYNNLVVQLFAMQIEAKTIEERLKICNSIYPILVLVG